MSLPSKLSETISHRTTIPGNVLDYSFCQLTALTDIQDEQPRGGVRKPHATRKSKAGDQPHARTGELLETTTLKLNNNALVSIEGFADVLSDILWEPSRLTFLDLSFNSLKSIDKVLVTLPNLSILYLHGNEIGNLKEVSHLTPLSSLSALTLHGNEVEKVKGYRVQVLRMLPQLKKLDFSLVTKHERTL